VDEAMLSRNAFGESDGVRIAGITRKADDFDGRVEARCETHCRQSALRNDQQAWQVIFRAGPGECGSRIPGGGYYEDAGIADRNSGLTRRKPQVP
jgi:hypothetical protein